MFKQVMIGLFAVSMVMLLWSEASAAKTCLTWIAVGGSNVCTAWRTGSEVCEVKISGLTSAVKPGEGVGGEAGNVDVECQAIGAETDGTMKGSLYCTMPNDPEEIALSTQVEGCTHTFNGVGTGHTNPGHPGDCNVFPNVTTNNAVALTSGVFGLQQCNGKTGICQTSASLEILEGQALCTAQSPGSTFVSFIADSFFANVFVDDLPGGVSCDIEQLCTLAGSGYDCVPTSEPFCSTPET